LAGLVGSAAPAVAVDPPHPSDCINCHMQHSATGGQLTNVAGNGNVCVSCHIVGGTANAKPFLDANQAYPAPGLPAGQAAAGNSHRWDSGPAGHAERGTPNTSSGTVSSSGVYNGRYPKTYTLTITTGGAAGTARFSWTATTPGGGSGTNLLTGANVLLDSGVSVAFVGALAGSFVLNDKWNVFVRPDLRMPTNIEMAKRLENGVTMCSTCHDQHSQEPEPFDPAAPAYGGTGTGAGRHYQRIANDYAAMCVDCHSVRNVTASSQGSHPVGVAIPATAAYKAPSAALPLDPISQVECLSCHQPHYGPATDGTLRRTAAWNALCVDCHTLADTASPGKHFVTSNAATLWPGGQYGSTLPASTGTALQGTCLNCHETHGWPDNAAPAQDYPLLLADREQNLCTTCHDGSPVTKNIRAELLKTYRHPIETDGRHVNTETAAAAFGTANRHAECADCHNAHQARADTVAPTAPAASNRIKNVKGVTVTNGAAGTAPTYTFTTNAANEYQVCFKCHSSWTTQPAGQTNFAVKFNPNNPSYHPVEAVGKNTNINVNAFVAPWTGSRTMYCTDCHSSDTTTVRGPHGSAFRYLVKKAATGTNGTAAVSSASRTMAATELCFDCHAYNTYRNTGATTTQKQYSRFYNGDKGHTFHVGDRNYPCYACHDTHGASTQPHLIVTGRNPGINTFTHSLTGSSTCSPTCHGSQTYSHTYAH
jgi:predicted CXXCH cytochrome family protein